MNTFGCIEQNGLAVALRQSAPVRHPVDGKHRAGAGVVGPHAGGGVERHRLSGDLLVREGVGRIGATRHGK